MMIIMYVSAAIKMLFSRYLVCIVSYLALLTFVNTSPLLLSPSPTVAPSVPEGTYCLGSAGICNGDGVAQSWYDNQIPSLPPRDLRVRMYILANDVGNETALSIQLAQDQIAFFDEYYAPMHLSFTAEFMQINNSFLFERRAFPAGPGFCYYSTIGDGTCNYLCNSSITNWDGGDCAYSDYNNAEFCKANSNNSICDEKCNYANYSYDGGDCCKEPYVLTSCKDPKSPLKIYYDPADIKPLSGPPFADSWNIYVILYTSCYWCGAVSTYPWQYDASSYADEGTIYNANLITQHSFGLFVGGHELGHTFGLLHPFQYAESGLSCQQNPSICVQQCFDGVQYPTNETGSVWIGDLIADTRPMVVPPSFASCENPPSADCKGAPWIDTPFRNLMTFGYLSDGCVNASTAFTPQQLGRMRCYLEQTYPLWFINSHDDDNGGGRGGSSSADGSLSGGAVAIIVIGCVLALSVIGYLAYKIALPSNMTTGGKETAVRMSNVQSSKPISVGSFSASNPMLKDSESNNL